MKCPSCGKGYGVGSVLRTSPGTPLDCKNCGAALRIDPKRAGVIAVIAVALCLLPLLGFLRPGWELFWILGVCGAAFYAYASQAALHNPEAVLKFSGWFSDKVELWPKDLLYKERRYPYEAVTHLARYARKTSIEFVPMEEYLRLAEKTFHARIGNYFLPLQAKGYFEYAGARFERTGDASRDGKKVNLSNAKVTLEPFLLIIKDRSSVLG